ncbi:MAG: DDE-type integrase/transposase/recombinase [Candidatus Thiodiazotropha taylori]|nr:DDE-type integrase/transposase/recombinase [Candidatus Thiodiazotropha taylori]MCW4311182.1 RNase H-like domain-containing protein [Candidatus Thiodiazotropha endolucinida]
MGQECRKCHKSNHFAVCCKTKQVQEISQNVDTCSINNAGGAGATYLGSVDCDKDSENPWIVNLSICKSTVSFKIDTGADVTIMSESCYKSLEQIPPLNKNLSVLKSPGGNVNCLGYFIAETYRNNHKFLIRIFVVKGNDQCNLLSRGASSAMKLVRRIDEIPERVFGKTGLINCDPVKIELRDDAVPYSVTTARRIPFPLLPKVEQELEQMLRDGIIEKVSEPSDWCAPIVPVPKPDGNVRICVDYKKLNESIKRELYMLPNLDDISPKLAGMTVFSKSDGSRCFFQLPLNSESVKLTTFITPFGRFAYRRVAMGLNLAPEVCQKKMTDLLTGLKNVDVIIDDILVYGKDMQEHDESLKAVLERIETEGLKLNRDKCLFRQSKLEYFGHTISAEGVSPSPKKVEALQNLQPPTNKTELQRVVGLINYLGRYIENLSTVISPITDLLKNDAVWYWGPQQNQAFENVKSLLTKAPVLAYYDRRKPIVVSGDASRTGLGAAIYLQDGSELKPIAFASRTLTETEKKWAQIELECLSLVYACEKFSRYLIGLDSFRLITDHRPLVPLINKSDIDQTPVRCQRLLLRLRRFNAVAEFCKGSDMLVSDCLSRSPVKQCESISMLENDINMYVESVSSNMPITDTRLKSIYEATQNDSELQFIISLTQNGWPESEKDLSNSMRNYFSARNEFSLVNGLLLYRNRIVIPVSQRKEILNKLHAGHQGITKCREFAGQCVWWPTINKDITDKVQSCQFCQESRPAQRREPLKPTELPAGPWIKIAADLCELNNKQYLIVMDYYSKYIEIGYLNKPTSACVIGKLENMFAHWGDPEVIVSDMGSVFTSAQFQTFAKEHNIHLSYSSPHFPQSNGAAESGVKIAKNILRQKDVFAALRTYRCTPTAATGYKFTPSELMIGRNPRIHVPCSPEKLLPKWPKYEQVKETHLKAKTAQEHFFNKRHAARSLPALSQGDNVRIKLDHEKRWEKEGTVLSGNSDNRTYVVKTKNGTYRRNRVHLQKVPCALDTADNKLENQNHENISCQPASPTTRSGRKCKPPPRYDDYY